MKRAVAIAALLAVGFIPTGCKGKEEPAEAPAYPVKIETVEGVRTVVNPAFPKEGVIRMALVEEMAIGGEGGGAESVLNRPQYLDVDAEGNIYILDWGDCDFKVFAPDGRLLRTFGKKGQGPGDFDIPAYFKLAADGRVFLLSGRQNQVIILENTGKYLSSFRLEGFCKALEVDRQNRIYYSQWLQGQPGSDEEFAPIQTQIVLFRADETGKEKVRLGEFPDMISMRKVQNIGGTMSVVTRLDPDSYLTSWIVGLDDRVYIGYNKDYSLDVHDPDWNLLFRFGREFAPVRHPRYKPGEAHPEFYPAFSDWRKFFDEKGNLWLEQYVEEGVKEHAFDVFSPEGIYLKQVRVPESLYLVRGDKAYSIIRQEDEFLVVKRFKLVPE